MGAAPKELLAACTPLSVSVGLLEGGGAAGDGNHWHLVRPPAHLQVPSCNIGSGLVLDSTGLVATCNSVVEGQAPGQRLAIGFYKRKGEPPTWRYAAAVVHYEPSAHQVITMGSARPQKWGRIGSGGGEGNRRTYIPLDAVEGGLPDEPHHTRLVRALGADRAEVLDPGQHTADGGLDVAILRFTHPLMRPGEGDDEGGPYILGPELGAAGGAFAVPEVSGVIRKARMSVAPEFPGTAVRMMGWPQGKVALRAGDGELLERGEDENGLQVAKVSVLRGRGTLSVGGPILAPASGEVVGLLLGVEGEGAECVASSRPLGCVGEVVEEAVSRGFLSRAWYKALRRPGAGAGERVVVAVELAALLRPGDREETESWIAAAPAAAVPGGLPAAMVTAHLQEAGGPWVGSPLVLLDCVASVDIAPGTRSDIVRALSALAPASERGGAPPLIEVSGSMAGAPAPPEPRTLRLAAPPFTARRLEQHFAEGGHLEVIPGLRIEGVYVVDPPPSSRLLLWGSSGWAHALVATLELGLLPPMHFAGDASA
eukprot:CAMPEP_0182880652 /NCGR_PEP_ID=MMETSP0034_2-20130328/16685_1 /TAXON_ID=156128 /ORGANISM="Nephroselmis pyriformis, Strain CCMP717" /LENGTH=539 /DNA_ID=CAMNT_0025013647 /DNA_START=112 /DNA_END=1728 /DNA_ORIENTATION=-